MAARRDSPDHSTGSAERITSDCVHFNRGVHRVNYHPVIAVEYFGERWISVIAVKVATESIPMERKQVTATFFLMALTAITLYFCYLIARPFLSPVFLAVMIAIVFHPVHVRIQARVRGRNTAALISTFLVLLLVVVPAVGLGVVVSQEIRGLYLLLNERSAEQGGWNPYLMHAMERLLGWVGQYINVSTLDLRGALLRWLEQISRFLLSWGAQVVSNIISFLVEAVGVARAAKPECFRGGEIPNSVRPRALKRHGRHECGRISIL